MVVPILVVERIKYYLDTTWYYDCVLCCAGPYHGEEGTRNVQPAQLIGIYSTHIVYIYNYVYILLRELEKLRGREKPRSDIQSNGGTSYTQSPCKHLVAW